MIAAMMHGVMTLVFVVLAFLAGWKLRGLRELIDVPGEDLARPRGWTPYAAATGPTADPDDEMDRRVDARLRQAALRRVRN